LVVMEASATRAPSNAAVDVWAPVRGGRPRRPPVAVVTAVSAGGAFGAAARYGLAAAFPVAAGGFAWTTFWINVSGCLLIGALTMLAGRLWAGHRLVLPFLGVGVLGGFTTFSTYVIDAQRLVDAHAGGTALLYLGATVLAALTATVAGLGLARWVVVRLPRRPVAAHRATADRAGAGDSSRGRRHRAADNDGGGT
jgi:CrcB protein